MSVSELVNMEDLGKYLDNGINVMFSGRHGVGKTEIIKTLFNERNLKWKYFSAATMDPWVDFIGIPKPVKREDGSEILKLIKPEEFEDDAVEAIFLDEFNRAEDKVLNAVMELLQFKSINGRKFNNLKVIWTAVNPADDSDYKVNSIDAAIEDRFLIKIKIPYKLDEKYLKNTHGNFATPFIKWWNDLPEEHKYSVSPRRLDGAIKIYNITKKLEDCLPNNLNILDLKKEIDNYNVKFNLENMFNSDDNTIADFFNLENSNKYFNQISNNKRYFKKFAPFIHEEILKKELLKTNNPLIKNILEEKNTELSNEIISEYNNKMSKINVALSNKIIPENMDLLNMKPIDNLDNILNKIFEDVSKYSTFNRKIKKIFSNYQDNNITEPLSNVIYNLFFNSTSLYKSKFIVEFNSLLNTLPHVDRLRINYKAMTIINEKNLELIPLISEVVKINMNLYFINAIDQNTHIHKYSKFDLINIDRLFSTVNNQSLKDIYNSKQYLLIDETLIRKKTKNKMKV